MHLQFLSRIISVIALLNAAAPAAAQVRSLTLGISTNCPYGGIAE